GAGERKTIPSSDRLRRVGEEQAELVRGGREPRVRRRTPGLARAPARGASWSAPGRAGGWKLRALAGGVAHPVGRAGSRRRRRGEGARAPVTAALPGRAGERRSRGLGGRGLPAPAGGTPRLRRAVPRGAPTDVPGRAAGLPATRARLDAVARPFGLRRVSGGRHGARQDRPGAGAAARQKTATKVAAVAGGGAELGRLQLGRGGPPLRAVSPRRDPRGAHAGAAGGGAPARRRDRHELRAAPQGSAGLHGGGV